MFDWNNATYVLTPDTFGSALLSGLAIGVIFLSQTKGMLASLRSFFAPFTLLVAGEAFFTAMVVARWLDGVPEWPRTLGYVVLWPLFCTMTWVGIHLRWQLDWKGGPKS